MFLCLAFIGNEIYIDETNIRNFCERCVKSYVNSDWFYTGKFILTGQTRSFCEQIEGLCAKKSYIEFLADFHFLQDRANFWQTDLF